MLIGFEPKPPEVISSATMPSIATTITTGSSFTTGLVGTTRGIGGGGCRLTSPPGDRGTSRRGLRANRTVVITPLPVDAFS